MSLPIKGTTLPAKRGVSFAYSTPGPKRQLVVTNTLTVGLLLTFVVGEGGFTVFGTEEDVLVGIICVAVSDGVLDGVSVCSSVLVGVPVSVDV